MSESSREHKAEAPAHLNFALITCSTSRFARSGEGREIDDPSGDLIAKRLKERGHDVVSRTLIPDSLETIRESLEEALKDDKIEAIIVCGGTGIAPRDVTIEAVKPILQKILPGFGELFRRLSFDEIGSAAIMTRAIAGVTEGKAVFCIPGSMNAVRLCLDKLISPEAGHIVKHARENS